MLLLPGEWISEAGMPHHTRMILMWGDGPHLLLLLLMLLHSLLLNHLLLLCQF